MEANLKGLLSSFKKNQIKHNKSLSIFLGNLKIVGFHFWVEVWEACNLWEFYVLSSL
jgi:hypothetical protein